MMKRLAVLLMVGWFPLLAPANTSDSCLVSTAGYEHRGLFIRCGIAPHLSSTSRFTSGGFIASLSPGYVLGNRWELFLNFTTGEDQLPVQRGTPVYGRMLSGGAGIELIWFLSSQTAHLRPFISSGFNFATLLNGGSGYNGDGPQLSIGCEWELSRSASVALSADYLLLLFHSAVGDAIAPGSFSAFRDQLLSVHATVALYPNIVP